MSILVNSSTKVLCQGIHRRGVAGFEHTVRNLAGAFAPDRRDLEGLPIDERDWRGHVNNCSDA